MKYIDDIFTDIMKSVDESQISHRDLKVFKSLAKSIASTAFITLKQGSLLVRLLRENNAILKIDPLALQQPTWSKPFRPVDDSKRMGIGFINDNPCIVIECSFFAPLKKELYELERKGKLDGTITTTVNKRYILELTENNIVSLVSLLSTMEFTIEDKLMEYYDTISSWTENNIKNQYRINTITNPNFRKHLLTDLGVDTPLTDNIIADRGIRYQYFVDPKEPTNLTETIAYRKSPKLWIDSNKFGIDEVFNSLVELKRFPTLLVFDSYNHKDLTMHLSEISNSLDNHNINNVGIYFRLSNSVNKEFNELIAEKQYNKHLNNTTQIVGVESTKIPKFLINSDWKPMSVVVFKAGGLRNSKTAIYANSCDLIVTYDTEEPIFRTNQGW